jgi:hypothetical protein
MQAIITKYLPVTNSRGSRIKATCAAGSITISYPYELSGQSVHRKAAEALVSKLDWTDPHYGALLGGGLPNGDYVFVFDNNCSKA